MRRRNSGGEPRRRWRFFRCDGSAEGRCLVICHLITSHPLTHHIVTLSLYLSTLPSPSSLSLSPLSHPLPLLPSSYASPSPFPSIAFSIHRIRPLRDRHAPRTRYPTPNHHRTMSRQVHTSSGPNLPYSRRVTVPKPFFPGRPTERMASSGPSLSKPKTGPLHTARCTLPEHVLRPILAYLACRTPYEHRPCH